MRANSWLVWVLASLCMGAVGCTDHAQRLDRQMRDLRTEISELRRSRADHRSRLEELQSRVFIMEDRLETARLAAQRQGRVPELPVVTIRPQQSAGHGATAVAEPVPVLRIGPSPAPVKDKSGETPYADADRKGIEAGARLQVSPVPPAPKVKGRAKAKRRPAAAKTPAKTGSKAKAAASAVGDAEAATRAYKTAYEEMRAGRIDQALAQFRAFGERYPRHDLSDNAQYWVGECFYARKEFGAALKEFRRVIDEHPTGNKVPDSLLKIGLSYQSLGDGRTAKDVLGQVVEIFPESSAARVARERLGRL